MPLLWTVSILMDIPVTRRIVVFGLLGLLSAASAVAQSPIATTSYVAGGTEAIEISFYDLIQKDSSTNMVLIGDGSKKFVPEKSLIFFEEPVGTLNVVRAQRSWLSSPFSLILSDFQDSAAQPIALLRKGANRKVTIILRGDGDAEEFLTHIDVKEADLPPLSILIQVNDDNSAFPERRKMLLQLSNTALHPDAETLYKIFSRTPRAITVKYQFAPDDYIGDVATVGVRLSSFTPATGSFEMEPASAMPRRPKPYKVKLQFPVKMLPVDLAQRLEAANGDEFVTSTTKANYAPAKVERATSKFYFEAAFSSTVTTNKVSQEHKRQDSGVFALHLQPTLSILSWNTDNDRSPIWSALRPLLESDVDTLPIKTSKSPNKTTFGLDFDLGGVFRSSTNRLQGLIFTNGLRFDSDRDFKVVTMYWHTEVAPKFSNLEQTIDQRTWRYADDHRGQKPGTFAKQPMVSSYRLVPSFGYDLGGTIRRTGSPDPILGDSVSRFFLKFDSNIQFLRVLTFGATDTSYYLPMSARREFRSYLEARTEVNLGAWLQTELFGLQNSIVFKFQRGEQPPSFNPVNALSLGFKLSR